MYDRVDFERYRNGCKILKNMFCSTQGPAVRRPGLRFVADLTALGLDLDDPRIRTIPFIFNELQAYTMVFFMHTDGTPRMVLGTTTSEGVDGLVTSTGTVVVLTLLPTWDIEGFDWAQSGDEMYIAQSGLAPRIIRRTSHTSWSLVLPTFTSQPADWSIANGWPERVTFHQQRLAFGANTLRRQTIWMTQAGDFTSFAVSSPLVDSDAVTFTLDSGTQNKIQWMTSSKSLHVGTLGNEWTVTGNNRDALTPSNILAQRQTNSGSEPNKPLLVGITTLFVERHGRTVNEFVYDYTYDSYKTSDMAILSRHLTEQFSIVDWTYQQTPDSIIWCVREDGTLLGITYQRQHQVVGWHRHDTDGLFKAITCIPGQTREDDVWVVVRRMLGATVKYYLEKLEDWFISDDAEDGRFLDSHLVYSGAATDTITGLGHLEGLSIGVLADGTVHPAVTVTTGEITLNRTYSLVVCGLPYTAEVRPNLVDTPAQEAGSALGRTTRATNVAIDFYKSLGGYVGRVDSEDGEQEEEVLFRVPSDKIGQAVPLFTGWYTLSFPEGFDTSVDYFIRQKQPLPMTIRAVIDEVEVHGL